MEQIFRLGTYGPHLWTRDRAREIRADFSQVLGKLSDGDVAVVNVKGVEVFDYSFANEFFGKAAINLAGEYPGRFIVVENLSEYTRENLVKALEGMGLAMIERKGAKLVLIGKVHPTDEQTFTAVTKATGAVTAAELSERMSVNLNAMNERLTKLTGMGLIRRDKGTSPAGREQFEYRSPA